MTKNLDTEKRRNKNLYNQDVIILNNQEQDILKLI